MKTNFSPVQYNQNNLNNTKNKPNNSPAFKGNVHVGLDWQDFETLVACTATTKYMPTTAVGFMKFIKRAGGVENIAKTTPKNYHIVVGDFYKKPYITTGFVDKKAKKAYTKTLKSPKTYEEITTFLEEDLKANTLPKKRRLNFMEYLRCREAKSRVNIINNLLNIEQKS